jgi:hypothetical protein
LFLSFARCVSWEHFLPHELPVYDLHLRDRCLQNTTCGTCASFLPTTALGRGSAEENYPCFIDAETRDQLGNWAQGHLCSPRWTEIKLFLHFAPCGYVLSLCSTLSLAVLENLLRRFLRISDLPVIMVHVYNPITWKTEAGGLRVGGQSELHSKTLSQTCPAPRKNKKAMTGFSTQEAETGGLQTSSGPAWAT